MGAFLGIDVGTTRVKAVVLDAEERTVVAERDAATPVHVRDAGAMHDPAEIFDVAVSVAADALVASGATTELKGISVTSMGEEVVLVDAAGAVLGDVLAWFNPLGRDLAPPLLAAHGDDLFSGARPDPSFSLFKLLWLAEHRPDDLARTACLTDVGSYVLWRLSGRGPDTVFMDWSHGSRTGLMNLRERAWDAAILAATGVDAGILPRLVASGTPCGELGAGASRRLGAPAGVPLVAGGHDHFCAAFAAGVREPGAVFLSAGTSEALLLVTEAPPTIPSDQLVDAGCFVDDHLFYLHENVPSGHLFRQWRALLFGAASDDELYTAVAAAPVGSHGVRCIVDRDALTADFNGVGIDATAGVIMRALLEGLALAAGDALDRLEALAGRAAGELVVVGQPASRPEWLDLRAGVLGRPLTVVPAREVTALGAAMLAQRGATGAVDPGLIARTTHAPRPEVAAAYAALAATRTRD